MLKAETSTLLSDGDVVTFGKAVGKGQECVKPIVARIELSYGPSAFKPLVVPASVSSPSNSEKSKSSTGRYGVDFSSSDDSISVYSDIEEIPAPSSPSKSTGQASSQNHAASAYSVFKRLFPPAIRRLPSVSEIASSAFFNPPPVEGEPESMPTSPGPDYTVGFDASQHDIYEDHGPSFSPSRSHSPMDLASPGSPTAGVIIARPLSIPPEIELSRRGDSLNLPSMDLPREWSVSPLLGIAASLPELSIPFTPLPMSEPIARSPSPIAEPITFAPSDLPESVELPPSSTPKLVSTAPPLFEPGSSQGSETAEMLRTLKQLEISVSKLQSSRRKYKARFNSNVSFISQKLSEFDDKLAEVDAEYNVLCDQVEGVQHGDVPDLLAQVEELRERVEETLSKDQGRYKTPEPKLLEEQGDVQGCVKTLHDLVDEMRALYDRTQTEMSNELIEIRAMREEAMREVLDVRKAVTAAELAAATAASYAVPPLAATIKVRSLDLDLSEDNFTEVAVLRPQTPVLTSLKRKRDDTDENGDVVCVDHADLEGSDEGNSEGAVIAAVNERSDKDGAMDVDEARVDVPDPSFDLDMPSPRKRVRRIASIAAQTVTAVTIGAVVTWSALAFS